MVCLVRHRPHWPHHGTHLGPRVAGWAPLEGRRFACLDMRITTKSLHSMVVIMHVCEPIFASLDLPLFVFHPNFNTYPNFTLIRK